MIGVILSPNLIKAQNDELYEFDMNSYVTPKLKVGDRVKFSIEFGEVKNLNLINESIAFIKGDLKNTFGAKKLNLDLKNIKFSQNAPNSEQKDENFNKFEKKSVKKPKIQIVKPRSGSFVRFGLGLKNGVKDTLLFVFAIFIIYLLCWLAWIVIDGFFTLLVGFFSGFSSLIEYVGKK
ncbi:hypothetical protein [Campylobacter geochelonis]|uniref:hypothetical protein n=1 Tax=Campylobacter geochelonis TaxID=1780362 RepID=UPI0007707E8A|nr:hypothetical protein [Campylobacter geochelonis]CZE50680.1 Uncharacterised protein [Campylobacter geochelonis]